MSQIYVFALTAAFNPTLLAATTLMLALDRPKRLLSGYLCGAAMTSITCGLLIVFALDGSNSTTSTAKHTINPIVDVVLGAAMLIAVYLVATGRDQRRREWSERRKAKKAEKGPPKWKTALSGGSAKTTFVVGALLTLPGGSYLAGLSEIAKQDASTTETVLLILSFNLIMLALLELPLLGYAIAPDWTERTVKRFSDWLSRDGGRILGVVVVVLGIALVVRGVAQLVS